MKRKLPLEKVYEPDEGVTHIVGPLYADQVTLCGIPDWLERTPGEYDTDRPLDCNLCKSIFNFCNSGSLPK